MKTALADMDTVCRQALANLPGREIRFVGRRSRSSCGASLAGGWPCIGFASMLPVSRLRRTHLTAGITFHLTGETAFIHLQDNSQLTLTASTGGELTGIMAFQAWNFDGDHRWDSNAPTTLHGTIYLPEGRLISEISNGLTPVNSCNVLIAKSLRLNCKSAVSVDLTQEHCRQYLPEAVLGIVALPG